MPKLRPHQLRRLQFLSFLRNQGFDTSASGSTDASLRRGSAATLRLENRRISNPGGTSKGGRITAGRRHAKFLLGTGALSTIWSSGRKLSVPAMRNDLFACYRATRFDCRLDSLLGSFGVYADLFLGWVMHAGERCDMPCLSISPQLN